MQLHATVAAMSPDEKSSTASPNERKDAYTPTAPAHVANFS